MIIDRGAKLTVFLVILVLSIFCTSTLALGTPYFFPGEINENMLVQESVQTGDDEAAQESENLAEDMPSLDNESNLPLEPIIIPPEPFMGAPAVVPGETAPELPQTGTGLLYSGAGCLMSMIGIYVKMR